jgi:DNA-binding NarL/FixJ family response regulator
VYVPPVLDAAKLITNAGKPASSDPLAALSPRELVVFSNLVNGMRPKDIADMLGISPKTVDTYRATLMRKLNIYDVAGLVKFASERKLTTATPQS